jgi:hypothetical protein
MPIQPGKTEDEQTFISRCMSEETQDYEQDQAYAICKSKWDTTANMKKVEDLKKAVKSIKQFT